MSEQGARQGLGRFVGGRFGLDRLLAATAAEPEAIRALARDRVERLRTNLEDERRRVRDSVDR